MAFHDKVHFVSAHDEVTRVKGINRRRIEVLTIAARRHTIIGPAHAAVHGFPEANAGAANPSPINDWRLPIQTSRNSEPSRPAGPGSASPCIDRAKPCETVIDRLPNALTMELSVKIGLSCGIDHHGDRPKVVAVERVCEIDPVWRDVGPRAAGSDRRSLGFHGNGRCTTEEAKSNGQRANNL